MSIRIQIEVQVMFFDTDCAGVVNNIAYLRFIETARTLLAEKLGMGLAEMIEKAQYPVVVRTEIDYRRPADETLIVECKQMLALIQMPAGKPMRLEGRLKVEE